MEYAYSVARATGETAAVMTAVQVVVNTIAEMILENERAEA
jgi:ABC-type phosphate transport system permease subunit